MALAASLVVTVACSDAQVLGVRATAPVLERAMRSFEAESILPIARGAAPSQLKVADGLLETDPHNRTLLHLAARGFALYGFGFVEDDIESLPEDAAHADAHRALVADATEAYDRAFRLAVRLLATFDESLPQAIVGPVAALRAALARQGKEAAPGMAIAGLGIASALNWNRADPTRVADLPRATALLERANALDPSYDRGTPSLVLGIIYAQPRELGGEPDKARAYFEQSIAVTHGRYLMPRVMMARCWATAVGDHAAFRKILEAVLAERPDAYPEARLANELARRRAARYLADEKRLVK